MPQPKKDWRSLPRSPGGGRKAIYNQPMKPRNVTLPDEMVNAIKEKFGNLSAGIRAIIEEWQKSQP